MTALEKEVSIWHETGQKIISQKDSLNDKANDTLYSKDFETVYYAISKSSIDINAVQASMTKLKKRCTSLSSANPLKESLRNFLATSAHLYERANMSEFGRILVRNGWTPLDPEEEMRRAKAAEERRRREAEEKRRKEAEEKRRREEEQKRREAEERRRREAEAWQRHLKDVAAANKRRVKRIAITCSVLMSFIIVIIIVVSSINAKENKEYARLLAEADKFTTEMLYGDALNSIDKARKIKSDKKTSVALYQKEIEIRQERMKKTEELKQEISTFLNTFKNISFKYGRPDNDIRITQEKILLLKKIAPDDKEADIYQQALDKQKKRKY